MNKTATALVLIVLFSTGLQGQTRNRVPNPPSEWSLYLKESGAPWENFSEIELDQTGSLMLIEHDAVKTRMIRPPRVVKIPDSTTEETLPPTAPNIEPATDDAVTKRTVKLSAKQAQEIYAQAWKACREFRFVEKKVVISEGLNLTLRLRATDKVLMIEVLHIAEIEKENPELARLLGLIYKHLSDKR